MPKRFGNYDLVGLLHRGGEAEVWQARDSTDPTQLVVIRIPQKLPHQNANDRQRHFAHEVEKLQRLNGHPHIISLITCGWELENGQDYPYLVMPYVAQGSLADLPENQQRFPFPEAIFYIQQAADALSYAHDNDIIHGDVKPANLLLGSEGILLSDFGIARDVAATVTRVGVGSPPYRAPEQRIGEAVKASDQYALAVTGFKLLTGNLPPLNEQGELKREGLEDTLKKVLPLKIAEVFMCALSEEPAKRFQSMKDFAIAFNRAVLLERTNPVAGSLLTSLKANNKYIIGVDIDRSHLAIVLADQDASNILELWSGPFDTSIGAEKCLTRVADELHAFVRWNGVTWEQVIGIGLATPGPLDRDLRRVRSPSQTEPSASQMPGWEGTDIPRYLEDRLKLDKKIQITLDNDANMGALGVSRYNIDQSCKNLVYIKIGVGIGAGILLNGQLYRGATNAAGEIGHSKVVNKEKAVRCVCGEWGCLETVAAVRAIVEDARKGHSLYTKYPEFHQAPILAGRVVGIRDVIQAAQNGDEASKAALESAAEWIGIALGTFINNFNPSLIVLDGEVVREYHDFVPSIHRSAENSSLQANWAALGIETCRHLDFPVAVGAAANVKEVLEKTKVSLKRARNKKR